MRLQFKARGHDFHVELIPVHSPLLRESCLVSYPPLTYMLKFSGFADLTSCRRSLAQVPGRQERARHRNHAHSQQEASECSVSWRSKRSLVNWMPQEHRGVHLEAQALTAAVPGVAELLEQQSIDTEAGMLSGISQKHNMRSSPCRFTEFCNSQCLSHFAAPFIVDRTETSIAESCE